ncbi:MAG: hypothetical protein WBE79_11235 [Candidatus Cybelea sp.]
MRSPLKVGRCGGEPGKVLIKEPYRGIAGVAEQTTYLPAPMVMIDVQILKKLRFLANPLSRYTTLPGP